MKTLCTTMLLCCLACLAQATTQIPEVIIYEGTTSDMYTTPLESFFTEDNPKPDVFSEKPSSTACWREYVGTWKIENGELYLVSLSQGHPGIDAIPLDKVDPTWVSPVKAVWFTGTIRVGRGAVVMRTAGFGETREKDIFLEIKAAKVISTREVDNTKTQDTAQ